MAAHGLKVWLVMEGEAYEGDHVYRVCATLESARAASQERIRANGGGSKHTWAESSENVWERGCTSIWIDERDVE